MEALDAPVAGYSVPIRVTVRRGSETVRDYGGLVTFDVEDRSAWYPSSYRFYGLDAGQHLFGTGFVFPLGDHVLTVTGEGIAEPARLDLSVTLGSPVVPPPPVPTPDPTAPPGPGAGPDYFSLWRELPGLRGANDIAIADLDGDRDLDVIVAGWGLKGDYNLSPPETAIWLNDGHGEFSKSSQQFSDNRAVLVACADVDGDGDVDVLLLAGLPTSSPKLRLWVNRGDGTFDAGSDLGHADSFVFGDVNGDGDDDLVVATSSTTFAVRLNDGKGGFGTVLQSGSTRAGRHRPVLADLDGDGDLDLVVGREVWENDGKGKFATTGQSFSNDTRAIAATDTDGDGDLDLILGNYDQPNDLYLNDGTGSFERSADFVTKSLCTTDLGLVDLDEDGDLDLIEGNLTTYSGVWLNEGGVLVERDDLSAFGTTTVSRIAVGDLDGDGDVDFVTLSLPSAEWWVPRQFRND